MYVKQNLGDNLYALFSQYADGKLDKGSVDYIRGKSLEVLSRVMPSVRFYLKDRAQEERFWKLYVLPQLEQSLYHSQPGEEGTIFIKSLDFAASLVHIIELAPKDTAPYSFLSRFMHIQNALFLEGGYFANTPFWRLNQSKNWRYLDSSNETIYFLWMLLLVSDYDSYYTTDKIAQIIIEQFETSESAVARIFSHEIALAVQQISIGAKYTSLNKLFSEGLDNPKIKCYISLIKNLHGEGCADVVNHLVASGVLKMFDTLKDMMPEDNILLSIPSEGFSAKIAVGGSLAALIASSGDFAREMLSIKVDRNFREKFPHLVRLSV